MEVIVMIELAAILLGFSIYLITGTIILYAGASFTGVEDVSLKKAFIVGILATIVLVAFSWMPIGGMIIIFLAVMILVRFVFFTTWAKGFVIAIIYVVIHWIINQFLFALTL
jgi:hypothetical protein